MSIIYRGNWGRAPVTIPFRGNNISKWYRTLFKALSYTARIKGVVYIVIVGIHHHHHLTSARLHNKMDQLAANNANSSSTSGNNSTAATGPSPRRRARLQRSERLHSETHTPYSSWEALVRDSFGQIAWPIKITSWELMVDRASGPPTTRWVQNGTLHFN